MSIVEIRQSDTSLSFGDDRRRGDSRASHCGTRCGSGASRGGGSRLRRGGGRRRSLTRGGSDEGGGRRASRRSCRCSWTSYSSRTGRSLTLSEKGRNIDHRGSHLVKHSLDLLLRLTESGSDTTSAEFHESLRLSVSEFTIRSSGFFFDRIPVDDSGIVEGSSDSTRVLALREGDPERRSFDGGRER